MSKSKRIAVCGVFSALSALFLIAGAYLPVTYTVSVLAAVCVVANAALCPKNFGFCLICFCSSLLVAALVSGRYLQLLPFALLFAPLCVAKYYVDASQNSRVVKWLVKVVVYEIGAAAYFLIYRFLFFDAWQSLFEKEYFVWIAVAVSQIVFFVYEYALNYVFGWLKTVLPKMFRPSK